MNLEPFALAHHDLSRPDEPPGTLTLEPLASHEADAMGAHFANMDPWACYPYPASALQGFFKAQDPQAPRFAIRHHGALNGAMSIRIDWLRGPYLQTFGLLPAAQGLGLGTRVLAWMEAQARTAGARNLWVCASDFNAGAIKFYERHGFMRIADVPGLVRDDRTEVLLHKRLTG